MEEILTIAIRVVILACGVMAVILIFLNFAKDEDYFVVKKPGVRVIKKGKLPKEEVECPCCHSIIEYTKRNVWYGGKSIDGKMLRHYVDCPVCHENILVREEKGGKE